MLNTCKCGGEVHLDYLQGDYTGQYWYAICNDCSAEYPLKSNNRIDAEREWNNCIEADTKQTVTSALSPYTNAYAVLQLPIENGKIFMGYNDIHGIIDFQDYTLVYTGALEKLNPENIYPILDNIFEKLNIAHPTDYHARSLSVSDIVAIKHQNTISYYFCDQAGWRLIK